MCWLFHDWSKWSEPTRENFTGSYVWQSKPSEWSELVQYRTCASCGKRERRTISH